MNTMGGGWNNPDYGFDPLGALSGGAGILGGLFGNSGGSYDDYMKEYRDWADKAANAQQPYINAGKEGLGNYQDWLNGQKDPSGFINNLMGQYQESPYAQYLQKQSLRGGQNAASAGGLSGSTPLMQQMQQNAGNIASQDQNQWLQNVLGINTQYGQGQNNLMTGGQNAANQLTNLYGNTAKDMADAAYGRNAGKQQDFWNTAAGIGKLGLAFL